MNILTVAILVELLTFSFAFPKLLKRTKSDPDEYIPTPDLIKSKGYQAEEHQVQTDDGYVLRVHRIPQGRSPVNRIKPVVFLQHGLLDASSSFVINFPDQSLGFVLADAGFDVWMGNVRGNTYGLKHLNYNTSDERFWDFSWDEMGKYDIPAMIDYILAFTNQEQLFYVGHSQGTLVLFSQLGQNPKLASQIKLFLAMGPVATVEHIKSPVKLLADIGANSKELEWYNIFGKKSFLPSSHITEWLADKFCNELVIDAAVCRNILILFCGPTKYLNTTRIPVYTTHDPAGTSTKNVVHFAQAVISGKFQMYDFGSSAENIKHYNQPTPPLYDLTTIKTPVALYWAKNDWLADPEDLQYLRKNLPNIVDDYEVQDWNHLDFIWAINAKPVLYNRMIQLMNKYL